MKNQLRLRRVSLLSALIVFTSFAISCPAQTTSAPAPAESPAVATQSAPVTETVDLGGGVSMEFILIPAGEFLMGSELDRGDGDETPRHSVTLSSAFYLGKYEVTQAQWQQLMGNNPSKFKGATLPVENVSWNDCQRFLAKLREKTGRAFQLPTEAQWEYACRAGTVTSWSFGDSEGPLADYAWTAVNSGETTHPVGQKKPNAWGLHDMHGNVWEWCVDWYENPYSTSLVPNPSGPAQGTSRLLRGGTWSDAPHGVRSAYRNCIGPDDATEGTGLRCALTVNKSIATDVR